MMVLNQDHETIARDLANLYCAQHRDKRFGYHEHGEFAIFFDSFPPVGDPEDEARDNIYKVLSNAFANVGIDVFAQGKSDETLPDGRPVTRTMVVSCDPTCNSEHDGYRMIEMTFAAVMYGQLEFESVAKT